VATASHSLRLVGRPWSSALSGQMQRVWMGLPQKGSWQAPAAVADVHCHPVLCVYTIPRVVSTHTNTTYTQLPHKPINHCYTCSYEAQKAHASRSLMTRRWNSQLRGDPLSIECTTCPPLLQAAPNQAWAMLGACVIAAVKAGTATLSHGVVSLCTISLQNALKTELMCTTYSSAIG
jgi:hypothetical protein